MTGHDWKKQRRIRYHRRCRHDSEAQHRQLLMIMIVLTAVLVMVSTGLSIASTGWKTAGNPYAADPMMSRYGGQTIAIVRTGRDDASDSIEPCQARYDWPLTKPVTIASAFDPPERPWMAGHRGVDLSTGSGTVIRAPAHGMVSFAGMVAGKRVVSIRHGDGMVSTFEPAFTTLSVGDVVSRGQAVARTTSGSDHCDDRCLHWGLKHAVSGRYVNPVAFAGDYDIVLKPD